MSQPNLPLMKKKIISLSGCIRGANAFGLAMTIEIGDINKNSILFILL